MMTCAFSVTFPVLLGCYHSKSVSLPTANSKSTDIKKTAIGDMVISHTSEKKETEVKDSPDNETFIEEEVYATNGQNLANNQCIDPFIQGRRQIDMEPLSHVAHSTNSEGGKQINGENLSHVDPISEGSKQKGLEPLSHVTRNSEGSRHINRENLSHVDPISEGSKKKDVKALSHIDPSLNRDWLEFPFFIERKTVRYLSRQKTKIMFIMRGLSGSGKSSVVSVLKQTYSDAVICSADDYFKSEDGSYNFDASKLSNAHGYCQHTAKAACQNRKSIIVIDNTNVKRWEMKFYLESAKLNGYVIVLVEPKTDWKFNPEELVNRNKHGVPLDVLKRKVNSFDDIIPLYYGWFLSHRKSQSLMLFGSSVFSQCLDSFPEFRRELLAELGVNSHYSSTDIAKEILLMFYTDGGKTSPLLHCTSRFCGGGKAAGGKYYHCRKDVQSSCGRVFQLTLTGLVMTKKTFGVRVILDENSLFLFDHPEESEWTGHSLPSSSLSSTTSACCITPKKMSKKKKKKLLAQEKTLVQYNDIESKDVEPKSSLSELVDARIDKNNHLESVKGGELTEQSAETSKQIVQEDVFTNNNINTLFPQLKNSGHGRCAHLTLKTARNVASKETNFDILQACDIEKSGIQLEASDFIPVTKGKAVYLGHGICCVYFDQPIKINTIFSGYY